MSSSIKDAMIKAGLVSKESLRREEMEKKGPQQKGVHEHHMKTFCSQCNKNSEDVEYYQHTNRILKSFWLCVLCADKHWIHDDARQTNQSVLARSGRFPRFYGPTKRFAPGQGLATPSGKATPTGGGGFGGGENSGNSAGGSNSSRGGTPSSNARDSRPRGPNKR